MEIQGNSVDDRFEPSVDEHIDDLSESSTKMVQFSDYQKMIEMVSVSAITPVVIISDNGLIKSVNPLLTSMTRYPKWDLIQRNIKILMVKEDADHHDMYLKRYKVSKQKRILGELRSGLQLVRFDGKTITVTLKVSTLSTDSGSVYIGVISDASSAKNLEWTRKIVYDVMPELVAVRIKKKKPLVTESTGTIGTIQLFFNDQDQLNTEEEFLKLNSVVSELDLISQKWRCERVQGDFDEYIVVCGALGRHSESHAIRITKTIVEIIIYLLSEHVPFRASIATGKLRSGIVGSGWRYQWSVIGKTRQEAKELLNQAYFSQVLMNRKVFSRTKFILINDVEQISEQVYSLFCGELDIEVLRNMLVMT